MGRARQIRSFWAWLPAFRVVAETEHLPSASKILNVTPSALSRSIRLLEAEVGTLFERTGRRIQLNAAGRAFLGAVRNSMREVHEGLLAVSQEPAPVIHLSAAGPFLSHYVLPIVTRLRVEEPELEIHLSSHVGNAACQALRRGEIDIALLDDPPVDEQLVLSHVVTLEHDVFVRAENTLAVDQLVYVAPHIGASGKTPDGWPLHKARNIGVRVIQMRVAIDMVLGSDLAVVLPVPIGDTNGLRRLHASEVEGSELFLMHRPHLKTATRTERIVDYIQRSIAESPTG